MKKLLILALTSVASLAITSEAKADIFDAVVYCRVRGIQTGQLALRHEPHGLAHAGLDDNNLVRAYGGMVSADGTPWYSVKVIEGPNSRVEGKEGLVNSNYLSCEWYDFNGNFIRRD